jgi:hypothetical protein
MVLILLDFPFYLPIYTGSFFLLAGADFVRLSLLPSYL